MLNDLSYYFQIQRQKEIKLYKMESKRISAGGRRGAKKDASNNTTKAASKQKGKGADEANVLRTRSGRTRTAASSDKTTATRKKASSAKTSNNDPNQLKEDSSEMKEEADDELRTSVSTVKVCLSPSLFPSTLSLFMLYCNFQL